MKYKIVLVILILVLSFSCNRDDSEVEDYEKIQLQQVLFHTNDIFRHYFDYLTIQDTLKKKYEGYQLLLTLKEIDTLYNVSKSNPLGLRREYYYYTDNKQFFEVKLVSQYYGIGWSVKIDSFLNEMNNEYGILKYDQ